MTSESRDPRLLLVGPQAFRQVAAAHIHAGWEGTLTIEGLESLSDLGAWDVDLILFRLSSEEPEGLGTMLEFLAQPNRAEAIAVVGEGEEDLGVGAVARGALDFIVDSPDELATIAPLIERARRRDGQHKPDPGAAIDRLTDSSAFSAVCHPIVELENLTAAGWEFLSRGPAGPLQQPVRFFRWGRDHDRLIEFDLNCLAAGLDAAQSSAVTGRLHFNLFPQTLKTEAVLPLLDRMSSLSREPVCIEISEPSLAQEPGGLEEVLHELKERRIELALDDIGFEPRGFKLARHFAPEVLKIDRRVTSNIVRHQSKRDIVTSTLNLGRAMDSLVIAEGVETISELEVLRELGVEYAQGFYWGKPTRPDQAARGLRLGGSTKEQS